MTITDFHRYLIKSYITYSQLQSLSSTLFFTPNFATDFSPLTIHGQWADKMFCNLIIGRPFRDSEALFFTVVSIGIVVVFPRICLIWSTSILRYICPRAA